MAKNYPKSKMVARQSASEGPGYITYGNTEKSKSQAMAVYSDAIQQSEVVVAGRNFSDLADNVSGRPGLTFNDYYSFRPNESVPKDRKAVMAMSNAAYKRVGIVRNIIDLMGDFASQGIRIVHPNKRIEKFYQNWFDRVNGPERSERFLNYLYRTANVVISRKTAKLRKKDQERVFKTTAAEDPDVEIQYTNITKSIIPWSYKFINVLNVEAVGGQLSTFLDNPAYLLKLPKKLTLAKDMINQKNLTNIVSKLPKEIQRGLKDEQVLLDPDKTLVYFYKKDDWEIFASPILESVLSEIQLLEKLRLADYAALDGAVSNLRIFKLGSLEHRIIPTASAVSKLASILESHTGAGTLDLVWGDDISMLETNTNVHNFLGKAKYEPTLEAIRGGLGIPTMMSGGSGSGGSGLTNNFMSLQTLIKRLEYGRGQLTKFWKHELAIVQQAMNFRFPAKIEFDFAILADEAAERALLIQLADRGLISDETLQKKFDMDPEMERVRTNRETKERDRGSRIPKASPWHEAEFMNALKKIALQNGVATPSQVGLELEENTDPPPPVDPNSSVPPSNKNKGIPQQGRPKNSKDKQKRKQRQGKPQTKAIVQLWALEAQNEISNILNPLFLKKFKKNSLRNLTAEELNTIEDVKLTVLSNLTPFDDINNTKVKQSLNGGKVQPIVAENYKVWVGASEIELGRKLTIKEKGYLGSVAYSDSFEGE